MIKSIKLTHFKKFDNQEISIRPTGVTLIIGGNNSGKSSIIQALAIWEFCRIIIELEEGPRYLLRDAANTSQGHGLSSEEFLPLALPSLNHLWTNLKPQAGQIVDYKGYTMQIRLTWDNDLVEQSLEFALSLTNDRIFIKVTHSTLLSITDKIPHVAYLPTFAGILPKENLVTKAERQVALGKGLAGSILRNMVYDLFQAHKELRRSIQGNNTKLSPAMSVLLKKSSKWEKLQTILCEVFESRLEVEDFNPLYQTVIHVNERRVVKDGNGSYSLSKKSDYTPRDIMSQGSGYLQWLSIFSILYSGQIDVLVLDEPDAHMHATLQNELLRKIVEYSRIESTQVIIATHSIKMIEETALENLLSVEKMKYLDTECERTAVLQGIGSRDSQRVREISRFGKIFFAESLEDVEVLSILSEKIREPIGAQFYVWVTTKPHQVRKDYLDVYNTGNTPVIAVSLRDRDHNIHKNTVSPQLKVQGDISTPNFRALTWKRRHIECYLYFMPAIYRTVNQPQVDIDTFVQGLQSYFPVSREAFVNHATCESLLECDVKKAIIHPICLEYGISIVDIARNIEADEVPEDIIVAIREIRRMFQIT
ncbi:hypothetical protein SDC9_50797 [bioreactor metagenome]|uniref:AAA+ ATPase domain-containing protein n=1 Tax=bioreactor metagenome TaxID=1076179 RepID=A0A644WLN0_9ZZZZ